MTTCVLIEKATGQPVMHPGLPSPRVWLEPGDAQWFVHQRFGQSAIANYEVKSLENWLNEQAAIEAAEQEQSNADRD